MLTLSSLVVCAPLLRAEAQPKVDLSSLVHNEIKIMYSDDQDLCNGRRRAMWAWGDTVVPIWVG